MMTGIDRESTPSCECMDTSCVFQVAVMRCDFKSVSHAHISTSFLCIYLLRISVLGTLRGWMDGNWLVHLNHHHAGIEAKRVIGL